MRLTNKTCFFFETYKKTILPPIFFEMSLVRPRKFPHFLERKWDHQRDPEWEEKIGNFKHGQDGVRDPFDEDESQFSLSIVTKKSLSMWKPNNNTRIVVVGASDVGISVVESLLSMKYVNFTHIYLLAPGGLLNINANSKHDYLKAFSTNYTINELDNLMLPSRIQVLDARMVIPSHSDIAS